MTSGYKINPCLAPSRSLNNRTLASSATKYLEAEYPMRLTLRTLLAYLDDVLDPADKEELAQKIASSEFAEDLVHRTRDTVRRLRLSAPQVVGTGMGLDPNTVAEYLDNVMPPEQVGDFERICLESDVHLAEATACHHVLTMVLGSPADVDPATRQRMYKIPGELENRKQLRVEPAHKTAGFAAAVPAAAPMPVTTIPTAVVERPQRAEVPDYLRAGSWWRSTNALIAFAALVLIGTGVLFFTGLAGWFGQKPGTPPPFAQNSASPTSETPVSPSTATDDTLPSPPSTTVPLNEPATSAVAESKPLVVPASPPQPLTPGLPQSAATAATPPAPPTTTPPLAQPSAPAATASDRYAATNTPSAASPATAPPAESSAAPVAPPADAAAAPAPLKTAGPDPVRPPIPPATKEPVPGTTELPAAATVSAAPQLPVPPIPLPTDSAAGNALPANESAKTEVPPPNALATANPALPKEMPAPPPASPADVDSKNNQPAAPAAASPATPPAAPPDSGTYMGGKTVLLRYDDKAGSWFRVEPRATVVPGERLLSLPEFRPKITLTSGTQLDLSGGSQILIIGNAGDNAAAQPAANGVVPTIELVYGRMVFINPTNSEQSVHLKLGPANGSAKLIRNARLGVEVMRKFVPGLDPRQSPAPVETWLYAPDGGIVWHDAAGEKTIDKGARWTLTDAGAGEINPDTAPPEWIDSEPVLQQSEQRYGAPVIESTLVTSAPAEAQLLEIFGRKDRKEVKSLATRSSIYVGLFQPFIDALRDTDQKASWKNHIDTLRAAMALSPDSAKRVYQAFVDQRGKPAAADLFEMLCSYNAEQIGTTPEAMKTGALAKLIDWLENDNLDYRVLAVQDLQELTGKRLMQNPAASLSERNQNVRRWRTRLEAGDLKPVSAKAE